MACEAGFEYKVFGFLQQAKHGAIEVTTQNMGVLIAPQVRSMASSSSVRIGW